MIDVEEIEFEVNGTTYVMVAPSPSTARKLSNKYGGLSRAMERLTSLDFDAIMWMGGVCIKDAPKGDGFEDFVFSGLDPIAIGLIGFVGSLMRGGRPRKNDEDESAEGNAPSAKAKKG